MSDEHDKLARLEAALRETWRRRDDAAGAANAPDPAADETLAAAVLARIRAGDTANGDAPAERRFLWRFVSGASVAAAVLLVYVAWTGLPSTEAAAARLLADPFAWLLLEALLN